jgi:hypothetical protein
MIQTMGRLLPQTVAEPVCQHVSQGVARPGSQYVFRTVLLTVPHLPVQHV